MNFNKPSLNKRLTTVLIDILFFAIVYCFLAYCIYDPILKNSSKYKEADITIQKVSVESGLYSKVNNKITPVSFQTNYEYEIFFRDFFDRYESPTSIDEIFSKYPAYFTNVDGTYIANKNDEEMCKFYDIYIFPMANALLNSNEEYRNANNFISKSTNLELYICIGTSLLIGFFIIPMFSKYGKSLGMIIMKTGLVNSSTGYRAKRIQIALRYFILILVECGLSLFLFGLPAIVSLGFLVFTKNNTALHDYFAVTMVVNQKEYNIYDSEEDFRNKTSSIENIA